MAAESFNFICELVRERSGIVIEPGKEYLVLSRLSPIAEQEGIVSVDDLVGLVRKQPKGALPTRVVEAMTTNETSFFRDLAPFHALEKKVIPAAIEARKHTRSLSIWSAASSSGQELYSIALLLREQFPALDSWRLRLIGTDLSAAMVERARAGRFSQLEVKRGLPAKLLPKYFQKDGPDWVIQDRIRSAVEFRALNLTLPWPPLGPIDIVLIRNVLIYFDLTQKREILDKVYSTLAPDGYLFMGTAETTLGVDERFKSFEFERALYYRRRSALACLANL